MSEKTETSPHVTLAAFAAGAPADGHRRALAYFRVGFGLALATTAPGPTLRMIGVFIALGVFPRALAVAGLIWMLAGAPPGGSGVGSFGFLRDLFSGGGAEVEPPALAAIGVEVLRWALGFSLVLLSRCDDALSLGALARLYYFGEGDNAELARRAVRGRYRGPRQVGAAAALGFIGAALVLGERPLAADAFWILPLWLPLHRLAAGLRRAGGRLFGPSRRYVIYDGDCGFCFRTALVLARLDLFGLLEFIDFRSELERVEPAYRRGLTAEDCAREMYLSEQRGNFGGFFGFRALARCLPLAWLFLPLLYLPGAAPLGVRLYRFIADNRLHIRLRDSDACRTEPEAH